VTVCFGAFVNGASIWSPWAARSAAKLFLTDVLLVPFLPRSVDVWALADIAALVDDARGVRDGLTALAVLNAADPVDNRDNLEAIEALADFPQLALLDRAPA
jgi:chromosome partitioning protein